MKKNKQKNNTEEMLNNKSTKNMPINAINASSRNSKKSGLFGKQQRKLQIAKRMEDKKQKSKKAKDTATAIRNKIQPHEVTDLNSHEFNVNSVNMVSIPPPAIFTVDDCSQEDNQNNLEIIFDNEGNASDSNVKQSSAQALIKSKENSTRLWTGVSGMSVASKFKHDDYDAITFIASGPTVEHCQPHKRAKSLSNCSPTVQKEKTVENIALNFYMSKKEFIATLHNLGRGHNQEYEDCETENIAGKMTEKVLAEHAEKRLEDIEIPDDIDIPEEILSELDEIFKSIAEMNAEESEITGFAIGSLNITNSANSDIH